MKTLISKKVKFAFFQRGSMVFVKNCNFSHYFLYKLGGLNVFGDALGREIAFLDYKNIDLKKSQNLHFLKGDSPLFLSKLLSFLILFFSKNMPNKSVWCRST